jgi:hypothetical protein
MRVELVLACNNVSISSLRCPLCGGEAGRRVGGSNIPLEVFAVVDDDGVRLTGPVCPPCAEGGAPELVKARDLYLGFFLEEAALAVASNVPESDLPF